MALLLDTHLDASIPVFVSVELEVPQPAKERKILVSIHNKWSNHTKLWHHMEVKEKRKKECNIIENLFRETAREH